MIITFRARDALDNLFVVLKRTSVMLEILYMDYPLEMHHYVFKGGPYIQYKQTRNQSGADEALAVKWSSVCSIIIERVVNVIGWK